MSADWNDTGVGVTNATPLASGSGFNGSATGGGAGPYALRFVPFTVLSAAGFVFNALSVAALCRIRRRTVHHTLLLNLAVCDALGSLLLWMYYNSPCLFPHFPITTPAHCLFIAVVLVAPVVLTLCTSLFSLLMLAINQYFAICWPLLAATSSTKGRAAACIGAAWVLSVVCALLPAVFILAAAGGGFERCAGHATAVGVKSLEICSYALACLIVVIVALYGRIYREVLSYRRRMPPTPTASTCSRSSAASNSSRHRRRVRLVAACQAPSAEHNYKAFVTTLMLWFTLVLFWLPFMVFHFLSMHLDIEHVSDALLNAKFYLIDFLPTLNFFTDPIIYGIRMREVRSAYRRLFAGVCPACVRQSRRRSPAASVRFSALDATNI
ncbi:hypothetical protein NP493_91g02017 [Ridgeia piscesae]|uniref:G-protein coupled receptors family 1 profile domain-containing protein n=1 Tax=Ridgeia piscesae TaxID=27915 RepID=A0AAD9P898_RIDPI|nr:hypothetical protein NP493_91g02017 [Ridgeia piscesae]